MKTLRADLEVKRKRMIEAGMHLGLSSPEIDILHNKLISIKCNEIYK
ncbi:hypothetical protein ACFQU5_12245 [Ureibacillus sp. GCM10028918]